MRIFIHIIFVSTIATSCVHPSLKLQKGSILDPSMDPQKTSRLGQNQFLNDVPAASERGITSRGGSMGASCPTCGS